MILRWKDLKGYRLRTADGPIGEVEDVLLDDVSWDVRYLVVNTGNWLPGPGVLISPVSVADSDWTSREIKVDLTREQVKSSPPLEVNEPVSRQFEIELHGHYKWPPYWTPLSGVGPPPTEEQVQRANRSSDDDERDPNLRSAKELLGYNVNGVDGEVGRIEDVVVDLKYWRVPWLTVATRRWLIPKEVTLAAVEVDRLSWAEQKAYVGLPKKTIKKASHVVV
jgi:sporulation protein YlmC with PRC-barrel domain